MAAAVGLARPSSERVFVAGGEEYTGVMVATRDLFPGEEITYDYKFPIEDEKIRYLTLYVQKIYDAQYFIPPQMFVRH